MARGEIYLRIKDETTTTYAPVLLDAFGRQFTEGIIEISRKERTASGRMVVDIINKKRNFTLAYSEIDGTSLGEYEAFYALDEELELTVYSDETTSSVYDVIMLPFEKTRWILMGNGLWTGVSFEFEEV